MKAALTLIIAAIIICSGCRSHKEVVTSEVCITRDSVSAQTEKKSEIKAETFGLFDFSAQDLEIVYEADRMKMGETVVYRPRISKKADAPKISGSSGQKADARKEETSDIRAVADKSKHKASKEEKKIERPYPLIIPISIIVLIIVLTVLISRWYRRKDQDSV